MQTCGNSGYWLLGVVIEKVSGMTYEDYVEKSIFEPLGGKALTPRSSAEMIAPSKLDDGTPLRYSMGLLIGENSSLLTFRRATNSGPATELRYDRGGGHLILKRQ